MDPDVYSDLQIVNCTTEPLYSGTGGEGFFNQWQMYSWFNFPKAPSPLVAVRDTATFRLQFKRGVGDQDDGADIQINVGKGNARANNITWFKARSDNRSAHFMQADVQNPSLPNMGPFAVATVQSGVFPLDRPDKLKWSAYNQIARLDPSNGDQCLAIVDLRTILPTDVAEKIWTIIITGKLSSNDAASLWLGVKHYMHWH